MNNSPTLRLIGGVMKSLVGDGQTVDQLINLAQEGAETAWDLMTGDSMTLTPSTNDIKDQTPAPTNNFSQQTAANLGAWRQNQQSLTPGNSGYRNTLKIDSPS